MNPLLDCDAADLPAFDAIRAEHVTPALDALLADADAALERAVGPDVPADHDALSLALDVPVERLTRAWSQVVHLQSVVDTPAMRAARAENEPRVVDFTTRLGADPRLYAKVRAMAAAPAAAHWPAPRRKAVTDALRDFRLGGADLQGAARERHAAVLDRIAALSRQFGDHVLDATDAWSLFVDEAELDGVPDDVRAAARAAALAEGRDGCKLTLHAPCYLPVMLYGRNRGLRETMFRACSTRASEFGPAAHDNTALMAELVALRTEQAALLGYPSHAHLRLAGRMARSPDEVIGFIRGIARHARPAAERELAEIRDHAARLGLPQLQAWDRAWAAEQLKRSRFAFSSEELRPYFTEPRVLQGLFDLIETLFGVTIREGRAPVWHPGVRHHTVWRRGDESGPVADVYLDLHARPGKQQGAWMDDCRSRWHRPDTGALQRPVAHLICNFAPPSGDQPALLSHDDVVTLFHEFGHGLHHLLTQVDELPVSGIAGVEHDAIELPSQFMENFCWEWEVLQRLTRHVHTGEPLPRELFDRMRAARHFGNGLQLLRHCEYGLFDMRLHAEQGAASRIDAIRDEVNAEVQPVAAPDFMRYPQAFTHLFDGGYEAGYYGYAWAEVLSADAYGAFEEAGIFDPATGRRFLEQVLEVGGSRPAIENFRAFRGRDPTIDALLRHQGLTPN